MAASAYDQSLQLRKLFDSAVKKQTAAGFNKEDATMLAVTELTSFVAETMSEQAQFHAAQLGFKLKRIADLEKMNAWQVTRITQLGG